MAWVYILECADGSFYTGSTINEGRVWQHNEGLGANFTRKRRPVKLVFAEHSDSIETAYEREKQIQGWSRAKKLALIEGRWNDLPALARGRDRPALGGPPLPSTGSGNEDPLAEPVEAHHLPSTSSGNGGASSGNAPAR